VSEPVIVLDVRKRFGRAQVLAGVSFTVEPATITHLTAANGAGKTTLLRVIAGLTRPDAGVVRNRPQRLGYTPERYTFPSNMSAFVYLRHMARIQGIPNGEASATIGELLDRLRLRPSPTAKLTELSKGNAQKVMIAQAFLAARSLLLLDEPTTGLDVETAAIFNTMIEERRQEGCAILRTGHGEAAPSYPFRALHLSSGTIAEAGTPTAMTRIVLLRTADSSELPVSMTQELTIREVAGTYAFDCKSEDVDRYLLEALARNWSVQSTMPVPRRSA
jgi:ABC-type multidrug transport system ATPase subunit